MNKEENGSRRPGVFITLEGGDGTGKSTQARILGEKLRALGRDVVLTREPGGTPQAEKIRDLLVRRSGGDFDPLSEALLLFAARREHIQKKILPALASGSWVVSDRFADSTRAFQGAGMGLSMDVIETLYRMVAGNLAPDLTFVFDIDPAEGLARSGRRIGASAETDDAEDRYERMGLSFQERLRRGFLEIAAAAPDRCVVIDAGQPIDAVTKTVMAEIERRFCPARKNAS